MSKFTFLPTPLAGCVVVKPTVFEDSRGYFAETLQAQEFESAGLPAIFVQDNESKSEKGVLRGMHFQKQRPQGKLVRVQSGAVYDAVVDLRPQSETFGKWFGIELSVQNRLQLFVPKGFAHGFLVLSDTAVFSYKCTDFYAPGDEGGLAYDDRDIGILWPTLDVPFALSGKDQKNGAFQDQNFDYFARW